MNTIQRSIEIQAPLTEAFHQWSRFENFPQFMPDIEEVRRLDDRHLHWRAHLGGRVEEWDAEITEMIPNRVIGWRSTSGAENAGMVHFEPSGRGGTRMDLRLTYEPHSVVEKLGAAMGFLNRRVDADLRRFKDRIEQRRGVGAQAASSRMHASEMNQNPGL